MSLSTARQRAETMLRFLRQRVDQMEGFHAADFRFRLADFCDFLDQDDVLSHLVEALQRRQARTPKSWFVDSLKKQEVEALPDWGAGAFAMRYAIMKHVRMDKVDLRHFTANLFPGSHLNETMMHWKRLVVHPFAADCHTLSRDLLDRLGDAEWVDVSELLTDYLDGDFSQVAFGPRAWTDEDDERAEAEAERAEDEGKTQGDSSVGRARSEAATEEEPALSPVEVTDLSSALDALAFAVRATGDADLRHDVEALRLEASRKDLVRERILARLEPLAQVESLAGPCAGVRHHL